MVIKIEIEGKIKFENILIKIIPTRCLIDFFNEVKGFNFAPESEKINRWI